MRICCIMQGSIGFTLFLQISDLDSAWLQKSSHCEKENTETVHIHQIRLIEHLKENVHAAFSLINSFCCPCLLTLCASAVAVCECVVSTAASEQDWQL